MPSLWQHQIESQLLDVLRSVALPETLAKAVDEAVAASLKSDSPKSRQASVKALDGRLARLKDLYELGDISRDEYLAGREEIATERKNIETSSPQPVYVRQRTMLTTLVDDWDHLTPDERRALVAHIFEEIVAGEDGIENFMPHETWKPYMRAVVPEAGEKVPSERKTVSEFSR